MTDSRGTTTYTYDNQNRLIQITTPGNQTVTYAYDAAGNRVGLGTPAGSISYSYDNDNRLASVSSQGVGTFNYSYDKAGNRTQLTLPNGVTVSYGYDTINRLTSLKQTLGSQTLASYTYTLDPAGNRTKVVNADGSSVSWTYDDAYRLTGETDQDPNGTTTFQASYSYDGVGNRTSATFNGQTTNYTYNNLDQLTSAGTTQYSYDGRGNLTQITAGSSVTKYTYDAADRLASATEPDGTKASYVYDADGRRVQQTVGSSVTNYLWDEASTNGDVVLETDGSGATQASYVLGDGELLAQTRSGTTSYYLDDGQGSVRLLTSSSGAVTDSYTYDAFGNMQTSSGSTVNPYLYTGQQFDSLSGLYDLRARYYDPTSGRFTSRDTASIDFSNPVELNRYSYAQENPTNVTDPSGHGEEEEEVDLYALILGLGRIGAGAGRLIPELTEEEIAILLAALGALGLSFLLHLLTTHTLALPRSVTQAATPTPDDDWVYFIHGTTTTLWGNAKTISGDKGGGDFGAGFYTFQDTRWGRNSAWQWAQRKAETQGGQPILVRVKMNRELYETLTRLDVTPETLNTAYELYYPDQLTGAELVDGPVGVNGPNGERIPNYRYPYQYKFEGTGIAKLVFDSILFAP